MYLGVVYIYDLIHKCIFNAHTNVLQSIYIFKKAHLKIRFVKIFVMRTQIVIVLNMCNKNSQMYKSSGNFHQIHIWKLIYELSNTHLCQCF